MKNKNPLISVIIPTFNCASFISEAIQSVLQQNYDPVEIIIIDDGSTDNTVEVIKTFGDMIIYSFQEHSGVASARNKGVGLAKGEFISFIDADDLWLEDKLKTQLNFFRKNPDLDVVIGLLKRIQYPEDGGLLSTFDLKNVNDEFALSLGCSLIRASVFEKPGVFDEEMKFGEDID
ncbi:MAG: glycosyltransferase, partial [Proteobacteria bacterium]|nr:glycosyltransferase [Pseudomonadota bacterium]